MLGTVCFVVLVSLPILALVGSGRRAHYIFLLALGTAGFFFFFLLTSVSSTTVPDPRQTTATVQDYAEVAKMCAGLAWFSVAIAVGGLFGSILYRGRPVPPKPVQ